MARPKIIIDTVKDRTPEEAFFVRIRKGIGGTELFGLLELARFQLQTKGPAGYLDDKVAQAAVGTNPRPKVAITTENDGEPDERIVVKIRRGSSLVELLGYLRLAEFQLRQQGPHGFIEGVELAGVEDVNRLVRGGLGIAG